MIPAQALKPMKRMLMLAAVGFKNVFSEWDRRRAGRCAWPFRPVITVCV